MIIVPVKEGENIERALKKFKRKYEKTGVVKELRRRQQFDKPSELKRLRWSTPYTYRNCSRLKNKKSPSGACFLFFSFLYSSLKPFSDEFCYVHRPVRRISKVREELL